MSEKTDKINGSKKFLSTIISFTISLMIFVIIYLLALLQRGWVTWGNLVPVEYVTHFVAILPGPLWTDTILLYIFPLIVFGIFYLIAPYTTTFFLKLHKLIYRSKKRFQYGIIDLGKQVKSFTLFRRSVIASLFAFTVSALMVQAGLRSLFRAGEVLNPALNEAEAIFLGTFLIISFVLLLFFPIWLLEDSEIVIFKLYKGQRRPPVIEGTHAPYINILQGYAGISTVIILITYIIATIAESGFGAAILTPIILIVLPFIITGLFAFPLYIYERNLPKLLKRIQSRIEKLNISEIIIPTFEDMRKS